ncbi:hypothetical protein V8B97DRAFT_1938813 [Scleroderma yunnanense]
MALTYNIGFALYTITGCRIILHVRGAASQLSGSINASQAQELKERTYSRVIFRVPTSSTCGSIYDDTQ